MSYIINKLNQKIAYKYTKGCSPGIVFVHGLNSDMQGLKVKSIEKYTKKKGMDILSEGYVSFQKYVKYPKKCFAHNFVMAINAEGNVTFCKNTKDNPKFYIGNLYRKS